MAFVVLGMPTIRNPKLDAAGAFQRPTQRGTPRIELSKGSSIGVPFSCNQIWCDALNERQHHSVTHFAMIHDDVCPEGPWLDVLMDVLDETKADMVSAAIPIKDGRGLTSTAVNNPITPWVSRRITMHELLELPETFGAEDVPWAESECLLANTGLFVCRLGPWADSVAWNQHNRKVRLDRPNGQYAWVPQAIPEDWDFCRKLYALGLRVVVTRKVKLYHERPEYTNQGPAWGAKVDEWFLKHELAHVAV